MLVRKNSLAITADAKNRTVGFPDEFAKQVATILSAEKSAPAAGITGKTPEMASSESMSQNNRK